MKEPTYKMVALRTESLTLSGFIHPIHAAKKQNSYFYKNGIGKRAISKMLRCHGHAARWGGGRGGAQEEKNPDKMQLETV